MFELGAVVVATFAHIGHHPFMKKETRLEAARWGCSPQHRALVLTLMSAHQSY